MSVGAPPVREPIDGVLLLDKPLGLGSTTALARAKYLLAARKAGHTGTLDPLATGLLPVCFGEATKFSADLLDADKTYRAEICLGVSTSTGDAEGDILNTSAKVVTAQEIEAVLPRFRGAIAQIPPMYSALKKDGRPLYEYARRGIAVERKAREVVIHALTVVAYAAPVLVLDVTCSKGTYIRTLAEDLGEALGVGAHLNALRRTAVGRLALADALTLDQLEAIDLRARRQQLKPVDALLQGLPRIELSAVEGQRFHHGQRLPCTGAPGRVRVYAGDRLLGVALLHDGVLAPDRLVATSEH